MKRSLTWVLGAALLPLAGTARAGAYVSPGIKWASFSQEPVASEPTPNLYGYGFALSTGYSFRQVLDFGLTGSYLPGSLKAAKFGKGDATLVFYGGELALTFAESVYLGLRGGLSKYELSSATDPNELAGKWSGPTGGVAIGAVSKISKTSFFRTTFEVSHGVLKDASGTGLGSRKVDEFALGIAYVYNSLGGGGPGAINSTIFKDFLNSIVF